MSKICIVYAGAVRHMIMVYVYTEYLKSMNIDYDMIYMDKYHEAEETGAANNYRFEYDGNSRKGKIQGYLSFIVKSGKLLKEKNYDFIIVWGELTAALLSRILIARYKNRYCVNVRDLFVGKREILNRPLNKAIYGAAYVTVSSEKYLEGLPKDYDKYLFFHSFNERIMSETALAKQENFSLTNKNEDKITILYIGNIRFLDHLYSFMESIANDQRYELIVAGMGSDPVKEYAKLHSIMNVSIFGAFPKEKTGDYLKEADVIYNIYGTEDFNLRTALSNKLYYAVCLRTPILVCKDTYMYEISSRCGIGYAVDGIPDSEFRDDFYQWYMNRDTEKINMLCDRLISEAIDSQKNLIKELNKNLEKKS